MGKNQIINTLLNKYKVFNITYSDIENIISKYDLVIDDTIYSITLMSLKIEELIAGKIKDEDIECLITAVDYFINVKALFRKKKIEVDYLDRLYEDAVEYAAQNYNESKTFRENILTSMNYLLTNIDTKDSYYAKNEEAKEKIRQDREYEKEMLELYVQEIKGKKEERKDKQLKADETETISVEQQKNDISREVSDSKGVTNMSRIEEIKESLRKIYEKYNIEESIIDNILRKVYKRFLLNDEISNLATLKIEQYIAEEIRKGNKEYQDLIEKSNGGLKILIKRISSCSKLTEAQLDRFYSKAIEYASNHYDSTYSLKNNIYNSMKTLSSDKSFMKSIVTDIKPLKSESKVQEENPINEGSKNVKKTQSKPKIQTTIKKQTERLVNISFLNNLPKGKQIDTYELVDILRISYNGVKKALLGEIEIRESLLQPLYFKEKVKNFEEYKKVMEGYANQESKKKSIPIDNLPSNSELSKSELESVAKISKSPAHSNLDIKEKIDKDKKGEKIDISFLKGLITAVKLGEILGISNVSAGKYLNGKALINKIQQDKLLKYYECRTMEELQEKLIKEQNENEKVDISFLKGLITSIKLGEILGVSQRTAHNYLNGLTKIDKEQQYKLLKYYGCDTIEELQEKILKENSCKTIEELQEKLVDKIDISFLKGLITEKKLAEILGVSQSTAHYYLIGKGEINKFQQDKLLKYYGCKTMEELQEKLGKKMDISFLKGLITEKKLAEILGVSPSTAHDYLKGITKIDKEQQDKLLKHYECKTMEELQEKILKENLCKTIKELQEKLVNKIDISFLKGLIAERKLAEILGVSQNTAHRYLNGNALINEIQQDKLLKHYGCKTIEELQEKLLKEINENKDETKEKGRPREDTNNNINEIQSEILEYINKYKEEHKVYPTITLIVNYFKSLTKPVIENHIRILVRKGYLSKNDVLNETEERILDYIKTYEAKNNRTPSSKEIAENFKIDNGTVSRNLKLLESSNYIKKSFDGHHQLNIELLVENEYIDKIEDSTQIVEEQEPTKKLTMNLSPKETVKDELLESVDAKVLLTIIKSKMTKDDLLIAYLLFGGYKGYYYSIDAISNFLKIEKEYVLYIKRRCLEEYKSVFDSMKLYNERYIDSIKEETKRPPVYEETDNI